MTWWYAVVESKHDIMNPTSEEKIRRLGARIGLSADSLVLDVASGRCGPALVLARTFGCRITCVEQSAEFVAVARERVRRTGFEERIEIVQADARTHPLDPGRYDVALCLGASFIWGGLEATVAQLAPTVRDAGFVVVGEPYWRTWPLPAEYEPEEDEGFTTLAETASRFEATGLHLVTAIAASEDDWDAYETLRWLALDEWLHDHPTDPDAERFRDRGAVSKARYLRWERALVGWVILAGRVRHRTPTGDAG